jgi:hypothetical protein
MDLQLEYITGADGKRVLTLPDERRAAVIAYVRENALRPASEIEAIVQRAHDAVLDAIRDVSEPQAAHKPSPDDWSIIEAMDHVVSVKRIMGILCGNLAEGGLPPGLSNNIEDAAAQDGVTIVRFTSIAEARTAAEAAHSALLAFIRRIDTLPEPTITFSHLLFGAFNYREWPVFTIIHDGDHTPQIRRIKTTPGFPRQ